MTTTAIITVSFYQIIFHGRRLCSFVYFISDTRLYYTDYTAVPINRQLIKWMKLIREDDLECARPLSYFSNLDIFSGLAGESTWRGGFEPVAGLILSSLFMRQGAEIPLAEVFFQLAQPLSR